VPAFSPADPFGGALDAAPSATPENSPAADEMEPGEDEEAEEEPEEMVFALRDEGPAPPRGGKLAAFLLLVAIAGGVYFFAQTKRPAPHSTIPPGPAAGVEISPFSASGAPPVKTPVSAAPAPTIPGASGSTPASASAPPAAPPPSAPAVPESRGATMISPDWAGHPAVFIIHFSSYQMKENADRDATRLAKVLGRPMHVIGVNLGPAGHWYRVMLGEFRPAKRPTRPPDLAAKSTAGMTRLSGSPPPRRIALPRRRTRRLPGRLRSPRRRPCRARLPPALPRRADRVSRFHGGRALRPRERPPVAPRSGAARFRHGPSRPLRPGHRGLFARDAAGFAGEIVFCEAASGSGRFLQDFRTALADLDPDALSRTRLWAIERSTSGQESIAGARLADRIVGDASDLEGERFEGWIFSNELYDALPVHRVTRSGDRLLELGVSLAPDAAAFAWTTLPAAPGLSGYLARFGIELADGQIAEINLEAAPIHRSPRGSSARPDRGLRLRPSRHDPLPQACPPVGRSRCILAGRRGGSPLERPGEVDLTAHVNWDDLERAGESEGFVTERRMRQAEFLAAAGLFEDAGARRIEALRLIDPEGIGDALSVLLQSKGMPSLFLYSRI
jgi:SAM-dependent MidA family methyltransferase